MRALLAPFACLFLLAACTGLPFQQAATGEQSAVEICESGCDKSYEMCAGTADSQRVEQFRPVPEALTADRACSDTYRNCMKRCQAADERRREARDRGE